MKIIKLGTDTGHGLAGHTGTVDPRDGCLPKLLAFDDVFLQLLVEGTVL